MRTKNKISAYILRGSAAALLVSCAIVALSSAINLPNKHPNVPTPQNDSAFGVNGQESGLSLAAPAIRRNQTLTFADRVAYQRAIEEVYWQHRIWPAANAGPKPPLDKVMSHEAIEKKVEEYLRDSQALEDYWQRPITPDQLQAEMERMAQHTKQPEALRELFAALGNDPFVIAECLARPVLAERLVTDLNNDDRVKVTRIAWLKEALRSWLAKAETQVPVTIAAVSVNYRLPVIATPSGGCTVPWTPTSLTNAPDARNHHTAVWTGSEMIVWGGATLDNFFNTGERYDPSTDSWTATSNTNAPSGRGWHTGVWTGSEMIVWGGGDASSLLNTGGRYSPSTDSWTATSPTNAPVGRLFHTAVWTGDEMIIWGGNGTGGSYFNTGGRYDPSTDSWTTTSTDNAPAARESHTAVWTGSEMIVWGGVASGPMPFATGGRYNPSADSWIATSAINTPSARYGHTAVWTGGEMIVWGGEDGSGFFNTGGRYDPSTDSWIATTTINAPAGREYYTAVWAGSEMIVWGGDVSPPYYLNTGGKYCPAAPTPTPTPTPTASPTPTPTPTATPTPPAPVVLYDQYNDAGTFATVSATFTDSPPHNCDLADDFVVPTGQTWQVQSIDADGVYFNGSGPANSFNVFFYRNSGGFPGMQVYSATNQSWTQSGTTFTVNLPAPAVLNAGTYWVEIQANMTASTGGEWGWTQRTVTSHHTADWQNPGGGFGPPPSCPAPGCPTPCPNCISWGIRQCCTGSLAGEPDQMFRLRGTIGAPSPTPTPTSTHTPTATATATFTPTPTASPTPTPTPTPCSGRCSPTPRPRPSVSVRPTPPPRLTPPPTASPSVTPAPRPTPPPRLTPPPTPTGSPRPTPAPRP